MLIENFGNSHLIRNAGCTFMFGRRSNCNATGRTGRGSVLETVSPHRPSESPVGNSEASVWNPVLLFYGRLCRRLSPAPLLTKRRPIYSDFESAKLEKRCIQRLSESAKILINSLCRRLILFTSRCPSTSLQSFAVSSSFSAIRAHCFASSNFRTEI